MRPLELLCHLNGLGVRVWADKDKLRYSAPKGALTDELRSLLVAHKERLLSFLTIKPITRSSEALPLSYAQQRLWFLDQLEPNNSAYNVPIAVRLKGKLEVAALEASLNEIVRRHEALRTSFETIEGTPIQVLSDEVELKLEVVDLRALAAAAGEQAVLREARAEAARGFDLATGPLLRARLLQLAEREQVLLVTMHHIVSDGWSLGVLVRELAALYGAYRSGKPSPLAE